jgi:hypothetical protein
MFLYNSSVDLTVPDSRMPTLFSQLLRTPVLSRIRRNHALEHATIHILTKSESRTSYVGRADADGFSLYGSVDTERLRTASQEALTRLRAGEHHLALHPNCGTNLLTAAALAASTAFFSLLGVRRDDRWTDRISRLPSVIFLTVLALIVAQPLGMTVQRHLTTQADPENMQITEIRRLSPAGYTIHRVRTTD